MANPDNASVQDRHDANASNLAIATPSGSSLAALDTYRSASGPMLERKVEAIVAEGSDLDDSLPALRRIRGARIGRIAAGAVGLGGAALTALFAALEAADALPFGSEVNRELVTGSLLGGGCAFVLALVFGSVIGRHLPAAWMSSTFTAPAMTGRLEDDLAAVEAAAPRKRIAAKLEALRFHSVALPLLALSFLLPLTLHFPFALVGFDATFANYAKWIQISSVVVGLAHVVLAVASWFFARKIGGRTTEDLGTIHVHKEWAKALLAAVVGSAIPGALLLLVPPILAAITGIAFIPFMFVWAYRRMVSEQGMIEATLGDATAAPVTTEGTATTAFRELVDDAIQQRDVAATDGRFRVATDAVGPTAVLPVPAADSSTPIEVGVLAGEGDSWALEEHAARRHAEPR